LGSFFIGALIGTTVFDRISYRALLIPGSSILIIGIIYFLGFAIHNMYFKSKEVQQAPNDSIVLSEQSDANEFGVVELEESETIANNEDIISNSKK
jgi:hypothetical protein